MIQMTGQRFDRLVVVEQAGHQGVHLTWRCRCDCGVETLVIGSNLRSGHTRSCGCLNREVRSASHTSHGHTRGELATREYRTWLAMRARVGAIGKGKPRYVALGMYEPWNDYQTFLIYLRNTIGPHPGAGWSLDRSNNDHGYFPGNIRWATAKTQANNRSKREAIA